MTSPTGYDPEFLSTGELDPPTRPGLVELPYTHFTVAIDPERSLAASTAVNIDGSHLRRSNAVTTSDSIHGCQRFSRPVRSCTPATISTAVIWCADVTRSGVPPPVAGQANADTFHYTVCAPQTATLNQSKTLWHGLEDYVLDHARQYGQRLSVFSGCIFADDDPVYRGVAIPRRFFKIAAWEQDSTLAATGYILDQTPSLGPILTRPARAEGATPPLGPYRTFQVPVDDIESATGLSMDALVAADRYSLQPAARSERQRRSELTDYTDIVL